jgi:hypothetical protein
MTEIWITAWIISALSAGGALLCARRSGLGWLESLLVSSVFFPSPLFVALGGGNSFIYAFDLAVPLALFLAVRHWSAVPMTAKKAAFWLGLGAAVIPLGVAVIWTSRECILYAGINIYRMAGAVAFLCMMSAAAGRLRAEGAPLLGAVGWMNVVLVVATFLQSHGWINSDVFYNGTDTGGAEDREFLKFITAGLFRGSLGIVGTLGWVAFLAQGRARGWRGVSATVGGLAGALLIVLCGSKTSLIALLCVTVMGLVMFPWMLRHLWRRLLAAALGLVLVAGVYLRQVDADYFAYTLGVLGLADGSLDTLNYRQERWQEAVEVLRQEPRVLLGIATPFGQDRGMAYFHNEYIGLLMSGGLWSVGPYFLGLFTLGWGLLRRRREAHLGQLYGSLVLLASLIQGASVNHVAPGLFFGCTTMLTMIAYGMGLARVERVTEEEEESVPELEPSPPLLPTAPGEAAAQT